jgi:competence protein CoiA
MLYAENNGQRIEATPKARAICPGCGQEVIAKCGEIVMWHWAHKVGDCDAWAEGETDWHLDWKRRFRSVEVTIKRDGEWHRADALTDSGWVVEFQHSSISPETISARERFYGNMIWVFDARESRRFTDNWLAEYNFPECRLTLYGEDHPRAKENYVTFRWKHPRKSIASASKLVYLDLGEGWLLRLGKMYPDEICGGWGHLIPYDEFMRIDA